MNKPKSPSERLAELYTKSDKEVVITNNTGGLITLVNDADALTYIKLNKSRFDTTPCEICKEPTPVPYSYCFDCEYPDESEKSGDDI